MTTQKGYIAAGFQRDCEELVSRFENANDIRFETFCVIWKEMSFSLIFNCHSTASELYEFCEEALHISKQFLLRPVSFRARIAGLYLLYGVYNKMPVNFIKIKIKMEDWRSIMELHTEIKEGEHLDANYILSLFIVKGAFHFCIFDHEFGLEKYLRTRERYCVNPFSILPAMKSLTEPDSTLAQVNALSNLYHEKKCSTLAGPNKDLSISLYNPNITEEIIKDIRTLAAERRQRPGPINPRKRLSRKYDFLYTRKYNIFNEIRKNMKYEMNESETEGELDSESMSTSEQESDSNFGSTSEQESDSNFRSTSEQGSDSNFRSVSEQESDSNFRSVSEQESDSNFRSKIEQKSDPGSQLDTESESRSEEELL